LAALGSDAKVLFSDDWTLTPPVPGSAWLLYVDGATAIEAEEACDAVVAEAPELGLDCTAVMVTPKAAPSGSPS
jgi:hypothetical protein